MKYKKNDTVETWEAGYNKAFGGGPGPTDFPNGISTVPFVWRYLGEDIKMEFSGGFVGVSQDAESGALTPELGWAVVENQGKREFEDLDSS